MNDKHKRDNNYPANPNPRTTNNPNPTSAPATPRMILFDYCLMKFGDLNYKEHSY
jgi:hypothetical protein